jgi:hypothetical protein
MKRAASLVNYGKKNGTSEMSSTGEDMEAKTQAELTPLIISSLRRAYKPDIVGLLLIGESPPAKGGFFYLKDRKIQMATYTARAFERAHNVTFRDPEAFLSYFKATGCYLDDLSDRPVDDLPRSKRDECLMASVEGVSQRIRDMNPPVIAIVLKKIEELVKRAVKDSGCDPEVFVLPFAGNHHQNEYVEKLTEIISKNVPPMSR